MKAGMLVVICIALFGCVAAEQETGAGIQTVVSCDEYVERFSAAAVPLLSDLEKAGTVLDDHFVQLISDREAAAEMLVLAARALDSAAEIRSMQLPVELRHFEVARTADVLESVGVSFASLSEYMLTGDVEAFDLFTAATDVADAQIAVVSGQIGNLDDACRGGSASSSATGVDTTAVPTTSAPTETTSSSGGPPASSVTTPSVVTTLAVTTTTVSVSAEPQFAIDGEVDCSGDGLSATVEISNSGSVPFEVGQTAVSADGVSLLTVYLGGPGPLVSSGESFSHTEQIGRDEFPDLVTGSTLYIYVDVVHDGTSFAQEIMVVCP